MCRAEFIAYVGDADLHDGRIVLTNQQGDDLLVVVDGASGRQIEIRFRGVRSISADRPVGMLLYALVETTCEPPGRRFVFANWDDEDEAHLEIVSDDVEFPDGHVVAN